MYNLQTENKKAILIFTDIYAEKKSDSLSGGADTKNIQALKKIEEEELVSLAKTILVDPVFSMMFKVSSINPATLVGAGQLEKIANGVNELSADIVIFNTDLSPRIQRNLEERLNCCVIDRCEVIIQIFADRARTREATLQAQLALLEYSMPRLTRRWEGLSQQRGGVKGSRGSGEKKIELDRRKLRLDIQKLKKDVEKVKSQRIVQRKNRCYGDKKIGAIVGYTNAGKSSLLKKLSGQDIFVEDKLFATLDAETRKVFFKIGNKTANFLLTDTVGFVSNLPHQLIDSFRSTLEEAVVADFLLILCDASHPAMQECFNVTTSVLKDLGCENKPVIVAINKVDEVFDKTKLFAFKTANPDAVEISVKMGTGLDELKSKIVSFL